ncbi:Amino acid permease [Penicillium ucsense]|uniref:Amino acid permease n=1 Tax=Penicillium ucsense TaxID=2839758 RepID=A0A8J8WI52_9EURO|nr:Amino acid permease [Penicillium ucsense]KAF7734386.1 Amino acid permease [Penicillium ucsense]
MAENQKTLEVFGDVTDEDGRLENLGYEQELKRSFGLLSMIGFSFSVVTSWTALSGVFIVGVTSGGPPVMIFAFIGVSLLTLAVAIPMAEMCSMYPVAGGQYSWVAALAPPRFARGLSYITGWFMLIGLLAMGATNNSIASNFILGMANVVYPEYIIERWHTVLLAYCVAFLSAGVNLWGSHLLHKISKFILVWNVASFVIITVTLLATNDHKQSASFVFQDFQNTTGLGTAMAAIVGILQACFGMCCYDGPSHMTEEMNSASTEAPKAIILAVCLGAVTGFAFLLTLCFCIGDIAATAQSSTGVPVIQIMYDSTGNKVATCILASLIAVIVIVAGVNILAEGSRSTFAFGRDHGLPFSRTFSKVERKSQVPVNAVFLTLAVQLALGAIEFGTVTGFSTVVSISTAGFYLSYAMALFSRLVGYFTGHVTTLKGPFALSTPISIGLNCIGLLFLLFASITFNFPSTSPVTESTMNYTSAAVGIIGLISIITWFTTGQRNFAGPGAVSYLTGQSSTMRDVHAAQGADVYSGSEGRKGQ